MILPGGGYQVGGDGIIAGLSCSQVGDVVNGSS